MFRQTSSRNQRAKGFKLKQALQIILLIAICIWLLYQIKHSYDKKRATEENNSRISTKIIGNELENFRLGRKDLPDAAETDSMNQAHNVEEKNEHEEEEQETKEEGNEEEGRGDLDDPIDDKEQYKGDEEGEQGEESAEAEEKDDKEETDTFDDQDNEKDFQEAREENYRKDDVAGSIHEETHTTDPELVEEVAKDLDEENTANMEKREAMENLANYTLNMPKDNEVNQETAKRSKDIISGIGVRENEILSTENQSVNPNAVEEAESKVVAVKSEDSALSNTTVVGLSNWTAGNEVGAVKSGDSTFSNTTAFELSKQTEVQNNLTTMTESNTQMELQSNSTIIESNNQAEPETNVTMTESKDIMETKNNPAAGDVHMQEETDHHSTNEKGDVKDNDFSSENGVTGLTEKVNGAENEESSNTASVVNADSHGTPVESNNSVDNVITEEEKDARTDLSTLADDLSQTLANGLDEEAIE